MALPYLKSLNVSSETLQVTNISFPIRLNERQFELCTAVAYRGGVWGVQTPPLEIPKALQNCAKLTDLRKLLKIAEFRTPTPQDVQKKRQ